jgi:hypothetical protein
MDIDPPASSNASQPTLTPPSTEILQTVAAERDTEHQSCHVNSNIIPCVQKKTAAPLDKICAKIIIERVEPKNNGSAGTTPTTIALVVTKSTPITAEPELCPMRKIARYVRIVEHQFNLFTDQLLQPLSLDWPSEHQAAIDALTGLSAESVMNGQTSAPAVRLNKCKATVEDVGHVATSFNPPVESEGSASRAKQSILVQSWGQSKINAVCQALIDHYLLQFSVATFLS